MHERSKGCNGPAAASTQRRHCRRARRRRAVTPLVCPAGKANTAKHQTARRHPHSTDGSPARPSRPKTAPPCSPRTNAAARRAHSRARRGGRALIRLNARRLPPPHSGARRRRSALLCVSRLNPVCCFFLLKLAVLALQVTFVFASKLLLLVGGCVAFARATPPPPNAAPTRARLAITMRAAPRLACAAAAHVC